MKRSKLKAVGRRACRQFRQLQEAIEVARYRADGKCERCKRWVGYFGGDSHHVVPRSLGGQHSADNLRILCRQCHDLVESKSVPDWSDYYRPTSRKEPNDRVSIQPADGRPPSF